MADEIATALSDQKQRTAELEPRASALRVRQAELRQKDENRTELIRSCCVVTYQEQHSARMFELSERLAELQTIVEALRVQVAPGMQTRFAVSAALTTKKTDLERRNSLVETLALKHDRIVAQGAAKETCCKELAGILYLAAAAREVNVATHAASVPAARALHNGYLNLKGNIRVFCRLRPELRDPDLVRMDLPDDRNLILHSGVHRNVTGLADQSTSWDFAFDHIFGPQAKQAEVFEEVALLVQSALDGYKVAIVAYGQTGGGKTYTMDGPQEESHRPSGESEGIIPRTVDLIFTEINELREKGWLFDISVTLLEVYNEAVHDLLAPHLRQAKESERNRPASGTDPRCAAEQFTSQKVESAAAVHSLFRRAARERRTASTLCNDRSSRSHAVFQLSLHGRRTVAGSEEEVCGVLSLVDLAGSERVEKSGASGERLKEAQYINRSLSALGDVVEALAKRGQKASASKQHIPYRNSRLTMLLKDSLGGDSKALMFVNISPCSQHLGETLSSLRFASKVHACNVGIANRQASEVKVKKQNSSLDVDLDVLYE